MCGIAALFHSSPSSRLAGTLREMLARIRHRGPDGEGVILGRGSQLLADSDDVAWGLGHVRLAILDLSTAGLQPMSDSSRRAWIVYNGEVYNYIELADELRQHGHAFRTSTDTEVILAAYRQWGPECVKRFRGMFAFVIVDLDMSRVVVARDRLGIKPLYFWSNGSSTAIVSEPKQLYVVPGFRAVLNTQQAVDYLGEGLLGHVTDQTMLRDVIPLEPGCYLSWSIDAQPDLADRETFWEPHRQTVACDWGQAVQQVRTTFESAVTLRLRSDVPVGTCLSGGIDSSSIVAVASFAPGTRMKTFSVCHDDPRISEEHYIDDVAGHCRVESIKLRLDPDQALADLDTFLYHQDEPVYSLSQYGEYAVTRLAREHGVPVLLNGQGGDEALCGYRKYAYFYLQQMLAQRRLPAAVQHGLLTLLRGDRQLFQLWQGVRYAPNWLRRRYDPMAQILRPHARAQLRGAWKTQMGGVRSLHDHQWGDLKHWSLPVLLRYQDRNSMAHSIEARVPLVDHELLELALTIPEAYFFHRGMTKRLLVDALGDRLPESLRKRRTKLGFDTPQARWMKGSLGELLEQRVMECDRIGELVERRAVGEAFAAYRQGDGRIPHFVLFRVACMAIWLDRFSVDVSES